MNIVLLLVACAAAVGHAKKCYSCSYNFPTAAGMNIPAANDNCQDPYSGGDSVPTVDCNQDCYKMKAEGHGQQIVIRGCGFLTSEAIPCQETEYSAGGVSGGYHCCSGDKCNGGSTLVATKMTVIALFAALLLYILQ